MYLCWYNSTIIYLNNISCLKTFIFSLSFSEQFKSISSCATGHQGSPGTILSTLLVSGGIFCTVWKQAGSSLTGYWYIRYNPVLWWQGQLTHVGNHQQPVSTDVKWRWIRLPALSIWPCFFYETLWWTTILRSDQYWSDLTPLFITLWYKYYANHDLRPVLALHHLGQLWLRDWEAHWKLQLNLTTNTYLRCFSAPSGQIWAWTIITCFICSYTSLLYLPVELICFLNFLIFNCQTLFTVCNWDGQHR